jgi:hypothetical protein
VLRKCSEKKQRLSVQPKRGDAVVDALFRSWRYGVDRLPNFFQRGTLIGLHPREVFVNRPRFLLRRGHKMPRELFPAVSSLQFPNVDFLHLQHRLHGSFRLFGILVVQHVDQHSWGHLPRLTEFVLEPAARRFLSALSSKFLPKIIHFFLGLAVHHERD